MIRIPFIRAVLPEARLIYVVRQPTQAIPEMLFGWTKPTELRQGMRKLRRTRVDVNRLPRAAWRFARNLLQSYWSHRRTTYGPVVPGLFEFARSHTAAEIAAYQWKILTETAESDLRADPELPVIVVEHEALLARPEAEARRIAQFAQVRAAERLAEFAAAYINRDFKPRQPNRVAPTVEEWVLIRKILDGVTPS